jgi:protein TonB
MYAERYRSGQLNPGSLGLSVSIVGGLIAAGMLSSTVIETFVPPVKPLVVYPVTPETPPPPEIKLKPEVTTEAPVPTAPTPKIAIPTEPERMPVSEPDPGPPPSLGAGEGTGTAVIDPPKPSPPVLTSAKADPRYAGDFQPLYPPAEQRAGNEGVVTLRVLIGTDGRVRDVERIASPSDAFWRTTEQRARARWRFKPATRDGVAYESWMTMTVRFKMDS